MTAADLIAKFGGPAALASELDVKPNHVAVWKYRGRIPAEWWTRVAEAAARRGLDGVTVEALAAARAAEARVA